ncbi:hypothetical protein JQX13_30780 [Archangium violaceum]|uniref:Ig-like domain-containing protein n=1 Tax=Archangium violaceum TaxID=83451 RepID=UPI00193B94C4|nr:hypothetical protein [Archangium violaceum]QRK04624.1 hypothetical protein JQX13_30780 [Archangium violaceum]
MSSWNGSRRAATMWAAVLLVVSVATGCGKQEGVDQGGSAQVQVTLSQELSSADVKGVRVEVRGPGISSPLSTELVPSGSAWQGTLGGIPSGTERVFEAFAYDAAGAVLYRGSSSPTSVGAGATVSVLLTLQQVSRPPPYENEPPRIDSVVVSATTVHPGGSVSLRVTAHDPNGDALSYAWTAAAGFFSSASSATTTWTAPPTEGVQRLQLDVTDAKGTSVSVNFDISVQLDGATGNADVSIGFNSWPRISTMQGTPSVLAEGGTTALSVTAVDAEGDALSYSWSTECVGTFSNPAASSPSFTLNAVPASGRCAFRVTASDGRGGQGVGTLVLQVGTTPRVNVAPRIDSFWQSAIEANGGEAVTLGLAAHDPEGKPVVFSWSTTSGTLRPPRWTAGSSEVEWVAPVCFDLPVAITGTVTDADGASVGYTFNIAPTESAKCGSFAVSGVRNTHFVQADGSVIVLPADLSTTVIGAWVPTLDGSSYVYRSGSGQANGTFLIPGVERTPYFLQFGATYLWTHSRNVDLSAATLGRPDVVEESAGTRLAIQLHGLSPWQVSDDLQLHSTGAGIGYFTRACSSPNLEPLEGTTVYMDDIDYGASLGNCGAAPARIEPAKGDFVYVTQNVLRFDMDAGLSSGLAINEARLGTQIHDVGSTDGGPDGGSFDGGSFDGGSVDAGSSGPGTILLKGTLWPLPTTRQAFDFRASQFETLALASHPSATLNDELVNVGTLPRFSEYGQYDGYPDLALATNYEPGQGDFRVVLQYGNPYPSHWQRIVTAQASALVPFSLTRADGSTTRTAYYQAAAYSQVQMMDGVTQTLVPQVGPPRDLRINGASATGNLSGVGPTPLVSWTGPALGTPTRYLVRLYELAATSTGGTSRRQVGFFYTTQTQFRPPPGFLVSGRTYMILLYAYSMPGANPDLPFVNGPSYHYASAFTGTFQP